MKTKIEKTLKKISKREIAKAKKKARKPKALLPDPQQFIGDAHSIVNSIQDVLDQWRKQKIVAAPLIIIPTLNEDNLLAIVSPLPKSTIPQREILRVSNNYLNFTRGRLFNNSGQKIVVMDAEGALWYFGTTFEPKELLPEN